MSRYVVLLRGVNVGGIKVPMADLRATLEGLGLEDVRTVLASGNALVTSERTAAELKPAVEAALGERFGYEAWVQVYPTEDVAEVAAAYPFDTDEATHHPYVVFCVDREARDALLAAAAEVGSAVDRVRAGDGVVYWEAPKGASTDSPVAKVVAKPRFKATTTTRNLRTVVKLT